nr:uncharacterized protein LOC111414853 [Onthophagus taurus]
MPFTYITAIEPTLHDGIIIGDGAVGIAVFSELSRTKTDVLFLVTENRIGGRINTINFGESAIDLGTERAHKNALKFQLFRVAADLGLLEETTYSDIIYLYSNRKEFPTELINKLEEIGTAIKWKSHKDLEKSLKNQNGKNVIFFAGEATYPIHYGSVHGAIHTGFREAEKGKK